MAIGLIVQAIRLRHVLFFFMILVPLLVSLWSIKFKAHIKFVFEHLLIPQAKVECTLNDVVAIIVYNIVYAKFHV